MNNGLQLHRWGIYRKTLDIIEAGTCGTLTSLRWTWLTPDGNSQLLYSGVLAGLLDLSENLADGSIERLHIEPMRTGAGCFAVASFHGDVVAEIEIHESLPTAAAPVRFLMADFTGGRVSNRPLVGHKHDEGALLITKHGEQRLFSEPLPEVTEQLPNERIQCLIAQALKEVNS